MDLILWLVQFVLCVKFASVALSHGVLRGQPKMKEGIERMGPSARPLLVVVAVVVLVGAVGLAVPAVNASLTWLVPWAAALLTVMMAAAAVLHRRCRQAPNLIVSLILAALTAFVAIGRWFLSPF